MHAVEPPSDGSHSHEDGRSSGAGGRMDRLLEALSVLLALVGGAVLLAAAALAGGSVVGRWLWSTPVAGDVELMQVACAVSIALFLPYCQRRGDHVMVAFFTGRASRAVRRRLDAAGHALLGLVMLLLAWRAGVGVVEMRAAGEVTMLLALPTWLTYLAMVPGLALSGLVALHAGHRRWWHER